MLFHNLAGGPGYFARNNRIGAIDVPNAATQILDLTGLNTPNLIKTWASI